MQRHRHQELIRFLNTIEAEVPAGKMVHVILDNYAAHKHPKVRAWLEHMTLDYNSMHDRLVANSHKSWGNNWLWEVYRIVWLLGVYLDYLKLTVTRLRAKSLTDYLQATASLRLVGGGFGPFFELQEAVDALVEEVDIDVEVEVDRAVAEIRKLYDAYPWMPSSFRDLLPGKNHLPNNKLRVNLLNRSDGSLGDGDYREHFLGDATLSQLILKAVSEQGRYSRLALWSTRKGRGARGRQ